MSEPRNGYALDFDWSFDRSLIWMEFENVLNASKELPPRLAQSENRAARAARRGSIRELEEKQKSVSGSDIPASEPPTTQYARIDSRKDAVFDGWSRRLPPELLHEIWKEADDLWEFE
jgi:hypothetical protein